MSPEFQDLLWTIQYLEQCTGNCILDKEGFDSQMQSGQAGTPDALILARRVVRDWLLDGRADETTLDGQIDMLLKGLQKPLLEIVQCQSRGGLAPKPMS